MRLKRNDIRTTRKVNPKNVKQQSEQNLDLKKTPSGRVLRSTNTTSIQNKDSLKTHLKPVVKLKSNPLKNTKGRIQDPADYHVTDELSATYSITSVTDGKRRRSSAENYITKRFLYDVVEAPKRSRHKKIQSHETSAASLMALSQDNLLNRMRSKRSRASLSFDRDLINSRSKHGRRLKPRTEYSPSHSATEDTPLLEGVHEDLSAHRLHKRYKHTKKRARRPYGEAKRWPLPDIFPVDDASPLADEPQQNQERMPQHSSSLHSTAYSDVLFNELTSKSTHTSRLMDELGVNAHFRTETHGGQNFAPRQATTRRIGSPLLVQSMVNASQRRQPFMGDSSPTDESTSIDLLNLCGIPPVDRFRTHLGSLDEIEVPETVAENDYEVEARDPPDRQTQLSNDDLEEEDLLAPELSILAGAVPASTTEGGSEGGGQLLSAGGSRRKSPVRPMQVLRTKTSAHTTIADSANSPVAVFASKSDQNSFVMSTSTIVSCPGRLSSELDQNTDAHLSRVGQSSLVVDQPQLLPEIFTDDSVGNQVIKPPTVVRLTNLSNCDANPVRPQLLSPNSSNTDGNSGAGVLVSSAGVLPSILAQPSRSVSSILQRVFVSTNVNRSTAPSNRSMGSISHSSYNSASNVRRRPTILKRSVVMDSATNPASLSGQRQTGFLESESDLTASSNRTSVFKPGDSPAAQKQAGVVHFSNVAPSTVPIGADSVRTSGEKTSIIIPSSTGASSTTGMSLVAPGPTKLLQLVTASSLNPVSESPPNLTASDKLFGRRSVNYNKTSFINSPGSTGLLSSVNVNYGDLATASNTPGIVGGNMPYRYAVVRGSADGKRYLVLGSHGGSNTSVLSTSTTGITAPDTQPASTDSDLQESQVLPLDSCQPDIVDTNASHKFEIRLSQDPDPSANDVVPNLVHRLTVAPVLTST